MMPIGGMMEDAEMDHILSKQDEILPSSGFAASVMEAVRRETSAPPPIPFPWKRALPGLVVAAVGLALLAGVGVAVIVELGRGSLAPHLTASATATLPPIWHGPIGTAAAWTALALLAAFLSVKLSLRLAASRA